jgi:uncharacterized membrane protein YfcA
MWEQYRKTLIPVQALIFTVCTVLWFLNVDPRNLVTLVVVMEACSLYGASMGARWSRRIVNQSGKLPLARR